MTSNTQEQPSILYLDDEDANLRIFKINFKRYYRVFTAINVMEAREILANNSINLIITDQKMPEMTGTEFLKSILPDYPDIIRIVLTGFSDIQDIVQAVNECSIHQYLTKPYENGEMKIALDKALEAYTLQKEKKDLIEELKNANEKLEEKVAERTQELVFANKRLTDSINYARKIQKSILPEERYLESLLGDAFILYKPKDIVGGDFYSIFDKGDKIILAVADCTGHGVPGAFMSILGDSLLRSIIDYQNECSPEKILNLLRDGLVRSLRQDNNENQDGMEIAIVAINKMDKKLEFAASRMSLIYFQEEKMYELQGEKKSIGGFDLQEYSFRQKDLDIGKKTTMYLFSDGFQDQFGGENNRRIGSQKLRSLIGEIHTKPMYEQKVILETFLDDWIKTGYDQTQTDDIVVLSFRV